MILNMMQKGPDTPSPYLTRDSSLAFSGSYELKLWIGDLRPSLECGNQVQSRIRIAWDRHAFHLECAYGMPATGCINKLIFQLAMQLLRVHVLAAQGVA